MAFTSQIKEIIAKESRPEAMAAIIRKLIHKIEVTESGVIVHFHVGENHFTRVFSDDHYQMVAQTCPKNRKGLVDLTRPVSKSLLKYKTSNIFYDAGSNSLEFGRE
jgi:hypothetical protein